MSINLAKLPDSIAVGALVSFIFDTAKNTSEGGISGRKSMRSQVIRNYMVSVAPGDDAVEFQKIVLAVLGQRYPFAMRDPTSYTLSDEPLTDFTTVGGTTHAPLYKTFEPLTGARSYQQRILLPVTSISPDIPLTFSLNGSPVVPTIIDPGIAVVGSVLSGSDDLRIVSGEYLVPVCILDAPAATIQRGPITDVLYGFQDVRLEEILENELIALTS
jgi:hypothetical protein